MKLNDYIEPPLTEREREMLARQRACLPAKPKRLPWVKAPKAKARTPDVPSICKAARKFGLSADRLRAQLDTQVANGITNDTMAERYAKAAEILGTRKPATTSPYGS